MSSSSRRRAYSGMGTRTLCMSRGACSTSSSTYPRGVSRSCRMHWSAVSHRSTRSKHTMVPGRAASIARQLSVSTALAARISSASSARMTRGGGTIARAWRSSRSWRSRSLNSSVGLSMTRTLGNRLQMARLSSVERWSATTMWSAKRLATDRNRSRIHASLRTGVTTTMRTGSDTVVRYDGMRVCDTGTGFAYSRREPRRVPGRRRRGVAPSQRHSRLPRRAGGALLDARRRPFSHEVARDWTRPLRLLWIDGDHVYESVKQDLALFRRHLAPGAIVARRLLQVDRLGAVPADGRTRLAIPLASAAPRRGRAPSHSGGAGGLGDERARLVAPQAVVTPAAAWPGRSRPLGRYSIATCAAQRAGSTGWRS